ncbi:Phospholipase A1 [Caenorhabditis elegans]|uniref:Phospholipase A1 n=1 Tax=Caenorhabditis elegans TaxID=6239 RepID=A0A5K1I864_CAEEL|nr:Phospholipase A1 [Caenorhabditis elegans]VWL57637.1 Phospholipase A1 [Caenorhabditis elegans]
MELKISTFDNFHLLRKILSFYFNFSILLISVESLRPRGIGLIRLPFGVSDHRSGPYLPNLYIAGNKLYHKTQPVPDVSLPGQEKHFSGHAQLNPFTHMVAVGTNNDFGDSWGAGYALQGVNFLDLNLRKNYRQYANMPHLFTDGQHQPFQNSFIVGAEVDSSKFTSHAVALDIPLPGLNEMFDFQEETLEKHDEELTDIYHTRMNFPIPTTNQRFPFKAHFFERINDIDLNMAHIIPNLNIHGIDRDKIVDQLVQNKANPTLVG